MKFAIIVFILAGALGLVGVAMGYLRAVERIEFAAQAILLPWQVALLMIAWDPVRFRPSS